MRRTAVILAAVTAVLLAAACGGSPSDEQQGASLDDVLAAVDGLSGEQRVAGLLELIEAEGGDLNLYTSMSPSVVDPVVSAFEDAYDLNLAVYRADSEAVLQRLLEEAKAGFHGADAVESSGLELVVLGQEQLVTPYDSPAEAGLVEGVGHERWTTDRFNTFVVSWNTDLVPAGEVPGSWEELADPRWNGKLAIEAGDVDWYKTLWEYWVDGQGKSEEETDALFEAIARNALVVKGHTVMGELMAAGEFSVGVNYLHIVENLAADGAPLAWEPAVEPVFTRANGVGLVEGATHPAAAVLFADWLLGDGQEVLADVSVDPVRTDLVAGGNLERVPVDLESLGAEQAEWTDRYERLLILGQTAEGS
jgi:iron(III) transport system substrate-binding protein